MTRKLGFTKYVEDRENASLTDEENARRLDFSQSRNGLPTLNRNAFERSLNRSAFESSVTRSAVEQVVPMLNQTGLDRNFNRSGFDRSFNRSGFETSGFEHHFEQSSCGSNLTRSGFDRSCNRSHFDRGLQLENGQASMIPMLGPVENAMMSSVVIMNRVDSAVDSPHIRKEEAGRDGESAMPFPALTRQFEVNLLSQRHIGLLVSSGFAGILHNCLTHGVLPLLKQELRMKSYQADAASVLIQLPWSYSFIWGFISDAVPIFDSRRKAYIILAWMMTMLACFFMALLDEFVSYRANNNDVTSADVLRHAATLMDAYVFLLILANFGCIVAIVIGETYVIAQTRRERLTVRGQALGTLLMTQYAGQFFGQVIADYAIFQVSDLGAVPKVTLRQTMLFFVFYTIVPLIGLCTCFVEKADPPAINAARDRFNRATIGNLATSASELQRAYITASNFLQRLALAFRGHWNRLRSALGKESTSRVIRFLIGLILMSEFSLTYPINRLERWCGMNAKAASMSSSMSEVFSILPVILWKYFFLNNDWRWSVFSSFVIVTMTPQLVYYLMATLHPASRNVDIYAVVSSLTAFLRSAIVILELALTAEIAPVGGEGAFVGIVVSMASSMRLMANTVSNLIGFMFEDVEHSVSGRSDPDRMQVAFALVLSHIIRALGLVALVFLPKQKRHIQRLHRYGDKDNRCTTWWVLACLALAFIVSTIFNALAIAPSTSCLKIVGGDGC
uniref:Transmembrane protein n=1 Tax=Peronospora matthiolae TaxID=2874970 RepID=A0AAV1U370_9STRA